MGSHEPPDFWAASGDELLAWVRGRVPCERMVFCLSRLDQPCVDEVIASAGVDANDVNHWLEHLPSSTEALREALDRTGAAAPSDALGLGTMGGEALLCVRPESIRAPRFWMLLLHRTSKRFTGTELQMASQALRLWQGSFNAPRRSVAGRLIAGHDLRLLRADPGCSMTLLQNNASVQSLIDRVSSLVRQRWPRSEVGHRMEVVQEIGARALLIVAHWRQALEAPRARQLRIELRTMEHDALPVVGRLADDRIAHALAFIHDEFDKGPEIADMASQAHLSPFHFQRLFRKQVGVSPKQYLLLKQLQEARWLLRTTGLPVQEIGRRAGFATKAHFGATFRKSVGRTPTDYREQRQDV